MRYLSALLSLQKEVQTEYSIILIIFFVLISAVVIYIFFIFSERIYASIKGKPFFIFNHLYTQRLTKPQVKILEEQFDFYNKLDAKHRMCFEHRVASYVKKLDFFSRDGLIVTDQMRVLISATAAMLTFGFRKYKIKTINSILIYPSAYYSNLSKRHHKGEFNPKLKMLVLSWEDFLHGYEVNNDNLNLGMHEMAHAIHLNSLKAKDVSALLFKNTFLALTDYLQKNDAIRRKVIETKYFRAYAFTNQYEFLSVLIETFYETPSDFRYQFPEIYKYLKKMLNFNYADY